MQIAIVGTGISGLTAAYLLYRDHTITVFEQNDYIGGHTNTQDIEVGGTTHPVDTGFIVFNTKTYPNFVRLLTRLGVIWQNSNMSFSVHCESTGLEYSPRSFDALWAQRSNFFRIRFWRMLFEINRFKRDFSRILSDISDPTLSEWLEQNGYSQFFRDYFIVPMGSAIWSAAPERFGNIPARFFVRFFSNHGFLNIHNQPQWLTIRGGSRQYVKAITEGFRDRIFTSTPVAAIRRNKNGVSVRTTSGETTEFDHVILATHSDQALALLADPNKAETAILGSIPYQPNTAVLHTDPSALPCRTKAWASWNYRIPARPQDQITVTYYMNLLQAIPASGPICVTLNDRHAIDNRKIAKIIEYSHPIFNTASVDAQAQHRQISGVNRTHYCGAYWGNGFHEDGVNSALVVCQYFGKEL
ncbi:MAG: FAD-dependent oxidoreductase [Sedimentisphaerales bacterium]|nr:FAD-dependent oxidoreductase [Sedimentisphaerales bacterium]